MHISTWEVHDATLSRLENPVICHTNKAILKFNGLIPGDEKFSDLEIEIEGQDPQVLTFLEFLFLVNNATHNYLQDADCVFYEGFDELNARNGVPVFQLALG